MKDMRKASNPFYLAFFLLVVCGVSTLVMAVTAVKTDAPIKIAQARETAESLKMILPPFDNDPAAEAIDIKSPDGQPVKLYTARNGGLVVGYAAEASASGFGGKVAGLVSFKPDGTIDTVIVKSGHSETPGIGTKVTDRSVKRTISDVVKGVKPDTSKLPPNAALDSYSGIKPGAEKWTKEKDGVHFVSGATYSSNAVCDLVWYAATAVRDYLAKQGQTESGEAAPVVQEQPADGNASAAPAEKKEEN
jgi:electron transport complex protein RnfG